MIGHIDVMQRVLAQTMDQAEGSAGFKGIRAPGVLKDLDGLESNRVNLLQVRPTLQTTRDDSVFAFGDCGLPATRQRRSQRATMRPGR